MMKKKPNPDPASRGARTSATPRQPTPGQVVALAAAANVDPRTAKKALVDGVDAIKGEVVRERLRAAMTPQENGT
jgi:hypothetical protein